MDRSGLAGAAWFAVEPLVEAPVLAEQPAAARLAVER